MTHTIQVPDCNHQINCFYRIIKWSIKLLKFEVTPAHPLVAHWFTGISITVYLNSLLGLHQTVHSTSANQVRPSRCRFRFYVCILSTTRFNNFYFASWLSSTSPSSTFMSHFQDKLVGNVYAQLTIIRNHTILQHTKFLAKLWNF
jgi:hypothetical protein